MKYAFLSVMMFSMFGSVPAQVPRTISYQGILSDSSGTPKPDGPYTMTFRLYDVGSGGIELWSETKSVQLHGGLFSTLLGDSTPFSLSMTFNVQYWLSIQIGADPELTPRTQLSSAPYSFRSAYADNAHIAFPRDDTTTTPLGWTVTSTSSDPFSSAIFARSLASTGLVFGLYAIVNSNFGGSRAVSGYAAATSGAVYGITGSTNSSSDDAAGVYGDAIQTSGFTYGVFGRTMSNGFAAAGVKGVAGGTSGFGVYGTSSSGGTGVYGDSYSGWGMAGISQHGDGVYAKTYDVNFYALNASGAVYASLGYFSPSDGRYKKNVAPLSGALDLVRQLRPVRFDWSADENTNGRIPTGRDIGLIAQEVKKVFPQSVRTDSNGMFAVNYSSLIPVLIQAVNELSERVSRQGGVIDSLRRLAENGKRK